MNARTKKRALAVAILLVQILGGYAAFSKPKPVTVDVKPKPGYVQTSTGRFVKAYGTEGCHLLTYRELGTLPAGEPDEGDGEYFCPR